ncbi:MAG: ExbD/TolR family protein [Halothiobacillaceae bacterium]
MNFRPRARESLELNLIPLIDVVFMLLIFFMLTTSFVRESALEVDLPRVSERTEEPAAETRAHTLEIDREGQYALDGREIAAERLVIALRGISGSERPLVVMADAEVVHQRLVTALDAARQAGVKRLSLGTRTDQ